MAEICEEDLAIIVNCSIPLCIILDSKEVAAFHPPAPYFCFTPRTSYLPHLVEKIHQYFKPYLEPLYGQKSEPWFDSNGIILDWRLSIGVLFDLLYGDGDSSVSYLPWKITVHFHGENFGSGTNKQGLYSAAAVANSSPLSSSSSPKIACSAPVSAAAPSPGVEPGSSGATKGVSSYPTGASNAKGLSDGVTTDLSSSLQGENQFITQKVGRVSSERIPTMVSASAQSIVGSSSKNFSENVGSVGFDAHEAADNDTGNKNGLTIRHPPTSEISQGNGNLEGSTALPANAIVQEGNALIAYSDSSYSESVTPKVDNATFSYLNGASAGSLTSSRNAEDAGSTASAVTGTVKIDSSAQTCSGAISGAPSDEIRLSSSSDLAASEMSLLDTKIGSVKFEAWKSSLSNSQQHFSDQPQSSSANAMQGENLESAVLAAAEKHENSLGKLDKATFSSVNQFVDDKLLQPEFAEALRDVNKKQEVEKNSSGDLGGNFRSANNEVQNKVATTEENACDHDFAGREGNVAAPSASIQSNTNSHYRLKTSTWAIDGSTTFPPPPPPVMTEETAKSSSFSKPLSSLSIAGLSSAFMSIIPYSGWGSFESFFMNSLKFSSFIFNSSASKFQSLKQHEEMRILAALRSNENSNFISIMKSKIFYDENSSKIPTNGLSPSSSVMKWINGGDTSTGTSFENSLHLLMVKNIPIRLHFWSSDFGYYASYLTKFPPFKRGKFMADQSPFAAAIGGVSNSRDANNSGSDVSCVVSDANNSYLDSSSKQKPFAEASESENLQGGSLGKSTTRNESFEESGNQNDSSVNFRNQEIQPGTDSVGRLPSEPNLSPEISPDSADSTRNEPFSAFEKRLQNMNDGDFFLLGDVMLRLLPPRIISLLNYSKSHEIPESACEGTSATQSNLRAQVVVHGVQVPLETPLIWLSNYAKQLDFCLHVVVRFEDIL